MANIEGFQGRSVLVVGKTGAGKSEVIRRFGGKDVGTGLPPETSSNSWSCTKSTGTYGIGVISSSQYRLVDTMGLLDTNDQDEKAIEQLARAINQLRTVVGVIYVVEGRMNPAEVEICDFLFNRFFHDLPPSRLLVLKTKCTDWEELDVEAEKKYLRSMGRIPDRILKAQYVCVDFHPYVPKEKIGKMISNIRRHLASWSSYIKLSEDVPIDFTYSGKKADQLQQRINELAGHILDGLAHQAGRAFVSWMVSPKK